MKEEVLLFNSSLVLKIDVMVERETERRVVGFEGVQENFLLLSLV